MRYAENLWGCLCGPYLEALSEIVQRCDRQRLVWGTDYGCSFIDVVEYHMGILKLLRLKYQDYERITSQNPLRLFGNALASCTCPCTD